MIDLDKIQLPLEKLYREELGLGVDIKKNAFAEMGYFPIGIRSRDEEGNFLDVGYDNLADLSEEDFVWFPIYYDEFWNNGINEVMPILFLALPGLYKTVLMKRFVYYFHKAGVNIIIFDPKSADWKLGAGKGSGERLHNNEEPDKLPINAIIPSFVDNREFPDYLREEYKGKIFSENIREHDRRRHWSTLGFSGGATEMMLGYTKRFDEPEDIQKEVMKGKSPMAGIKLHPEIRRSIVTRLGTMIEDNFFNKNYPGFDLIKNWNKKKIPTISFFSQDERYISDVVGNNVYKIKIIQESFQRELGKMPPPAMAVCDDCSFYAKEPDMAKSLSVAQLNNALNVWRGLNINVMFAIQNPDLMNPILLESVKHIFCSKLGNVGKLTEYIDPGVVYTIKELKYEPERHIVEYCWVHPDRLSCETFLPLGSIIGHTW